MSNPFLRAKQQNVATQPQGSALSSNGPRIPTGTSFQSAPPKISAPSAPFYSNPSAGRSVPPPPTVSSMTQQMANMSLSPQGPPTSTLPPPPTGSAQGSYLSTKSGYQLPASAYQYGSASQTESSGNAYYAAESGSQGPASTPAYIGGGHTYDAAAPAPASPDPEVLPDEEYAKVTYEIAPNSTSLQGLAGIPFGAIFRPMAVEGVGVIALVHGRARFRWCLRARWACSAASVAACT